MRIQTNLNNFSVANELMAIFSGHQQTYGITINKNRVLPDIGHCPLCACKLSKNGYNECENKKAKAFGLTLKKGRIICPNPDCDFKLNIFS